MQYGIFSMRWVTALHGSFSGSGDYCCVDIVQWDRQRGYMLASIISLQLCQRVAFMRNLTTIQSFWKSDSTESTKIYWTTPESTMRKPEFIWKSTQICCVYWNRLQRNRNVWDIQESTEFIRIRQNQLWENHSLRQNVLAESNKTYQHLVLWRKNVKGQLQNPQYKPESINSLVSPLDSRVDYMYSKRGGSVFDPCERWLTYRRPCLRMTARNLSGAKGGCYRYCTAAWKRWK